VIFIVSQATSSAGQTMQVVVAKKDIPANTILTTNATDATNNLLNIQEAFEVKSFPVALAPPNSYAYTTQDSLQVYLNDEVVLTPILQGDVLRSPDARIQKLGSSAVGSLTSVKPDQIQSGDVLFAFTLNNPLGGTRSLVVAGDYIDVLATECGLPGTGGCVTQTTLQNVYVYATFTNSVVVVLDHQRALDLKYLIETGKIDLAIRNPKESGSNAPSQSTTAVTPAYISNQFNF
jgi:Flp pilus assembly protein CpaB